VFSFVNNYMSMLPNVSEGGKDCLQVVQSVLIDYFMSKQHLSYPLLDGSVMVLMDIRSMNS